MRRDNPADEALPFKLSLQGRQLVVAPAGDIDLTNAHMLTTAVLAAASETNPLLILIDLTDVTFFESAFLAAVIGCQQDLAVSGMA